MQSSTIMQINGTHIVITYAGYLHSDKPIKTASYELSSWINAEHEETLRFVE